MRIKLRRARFLEDQAGGAFGSAAVPRPKGSSFTGTSHAVKCVLFITFVFEFFSSTEGIAALT